MKAAIHTHYGSPNVLRVEEVPAPRLGADQILVEVHAAPVTQGDRRLRAADFPGIGAIAGRLMFGILRPRRGRPGTNFAGRVIAVGADVTRFAVGDDVFGSCDYGACAEQLAVDEGSPVAKIPEGFDYDEAAAIPYGAGTALAFLRDIAEVQPGERVLIVGAAGGVGRFAVQVARHLGAEVTGVCRGSDSALVKRLGASAVIDYQREDYTAGGQSYDVIFDTADSEGFRRARQALRPGGRYVSVYLDTRMLLQMLMTSILGDRRALSGVVMGEQRRTEELAALMEQGAIWPVLGPQFPLDQTPQAHAAFEHDRPQGALTIRISATSRYPEHDQENTPPLPLLQHRA